jgi:hypothetical protein
MYRVLTTDDHRLGMYLLLRAGARLDSEFFPESLHREGFANIEDYARFLHERGVDLVLAQPGYDRQFGSNEVELLQSLADRSDACVDGLSVEHHPDDGSGLAAFDIRACETAS